MATEWKAPEWMVKYLADIQMTGQYTVTHLMNDQQTKWEDNPQKTLRIISVRAQVKLLNELHSLGRLK